MTMKIKTSNIILLGYLGLLLLLTTATLIFGFSNKDELSHVSRYPEASIDTKALESFRVLHISGDAKVRLTTSPSHAIDFISYPNETNTSEVNYRVANDTCFIDVWVRKGLAEAVLKAPELDAILIMNGAELFMSEFIQEQLSLHIHSAKVKISSRKSEVKALYLVAEDDSKAELYGIHHLHVDLKASQVTLFDYAEEIIGILESNSKLELRGGGSKLNLEKSKDSKIFIR
jgi:hypothetical protein